MILLLIYLLPKPSKNERNELIKIIDNMILSIKKNEKHLDKLILLKTGLMQDLLTGKVRVTELLKEKEITNP